ncbi:MAG: TonB-dependent receptor [Saprospiraceae bacterium]|nr:TonB-dependent receptor [Saprospiraceae bacterium]
MFRKFLSLAFLCISLYSFAQVSGTVKDNKGEPMIGVSVLIKGTDTGTVTDFDGKYELDVSSGTLIFSFVGYTSQEIVIDGKSVVDVALSEESTLLESVVVIGYGTQKKKDLTSAVVVVDEKSIKERPMVSAAEALQGKAAGVQVIQPSGKPGGDISVRVRGATSVLAGNEPLYVVDGVPTTDIRGLNPNDIATMTVLKDASSSSIYGARAANGVVLITTRRGKANTTQISFNAYYGISRLNKTIDVLSTRRYRELMEEIIPGGLDPTWTANTDWNQEVFGTGTNQSYQLSMSGGSEKSRYLLSGNYLKSDGIVRPASFERYSLRLNLDNDVRSWLSVGTNINAILSNTENTQDNASSGRGGVIMSALNTPPFLRIYKTDGSGQYDPNPFQPSWENPVAYMEGPEQLVRDNRLFGNTYLNVNFGKGLQFKSNLGIDLQTHQWDYYLDPFKTNYGRNQNGLGIADKSTTYTWLTENTLTYTGSVDKHHYTALAGSSVQKQAWNDSYLQGNDFPDDTTVKTLNAANTISGSTDRSAWALASFFGRVTYDYDGNYLFSASLRRDGSSKLAHHWGVMPAFSAAWRVSSASFIKDISAIEDLKIRVGWGRNGNQEGISNYARFGLVSYYRRTPSSPLSGPGSAQVSYGNPDLKWETTDQTNLGIDLLMFNGRVSFTADAYLKKTSDVLLDVQLSNSLPITTIQTNAGNIQNKGIDLALSTVNMDRSIRWQTDFNISFNKNEVTDLKYTDVYYFGRIYSNNQDVAIVKKGLPLGSFFGYVSEGVNPETGDLMYKDLNNNNIFDPGDRTIIGNAQPDFVFGLTNNFSWKGFDLDIFIQGSYGNDIFNATRIDLEGMFDSKNQSVSVLNRWTPDNRITDMPRAIGNGNVKNVLNSTRFIEDGSYIRIKSLTLAYNFSGTWLTKAGLSALRLYATGQNLFTITGYSGYDPEVNAFGRSATELGIDYGTYPHSMVVTMGVKADF